MAECSESTSTFKPIRESAPTKTPSPQFLCVDETKRPRANSDPVGLHIHICGVPEITVTGEDGRDGGCAEEDESDSFLIPPSPRRRANTCPEDMFRVRKGRPPTPPPTDFRILRSPGSKRFSFNFNPKDASSVSFAHHRLSKVSEEKPELQQQKASSITSCKLTVRTRTRLCSCPSRVTQTSESFTAQTDVTLSRLQWRSDETEDGPEKSEDQGISKQFKVMSVAESSVARTTNNNEKSPSETKTNADVITESFKSKDCAKDNAGNENLRAF